MKVNNKQYFSITKKFTNWLSILLILSLAATLYFYQINRESLWIDEIISTRDSQTIIGKFELNRPLYLILLNVWMRFGDSEAWLRSLSVVFGLIGVWLIYQLGFRLANQTTGLIAALLLTLSPLVINHAQEVRMYSMSMCLGLGGSLILMDVLEKFAISSLVGWLCLRFLAVLTMPTNILLFLPDVVLLGVKFRNQKKHLLKLVKKWLWLLIVLTVAFLIVISGFLPRLLGFLGDSRQVLPPPGIPAFVGALTRFTVWPLASPFISSELISEKFFNLYAVILLGLLGFALFARTKSPSIKLWWAAAWSFLPLTILFIFCQTYTKLWGVDRYLLFTAPYILILLAAGWLRLWRWQKGIAILVAVIYAITVGGALFNYYTVQYREDWQGVVQTISVDEQPGDVITLFPNNLLPALEYYYQGDSPINTIERLPEEKLFQPVDKSFVQQMLQNLPSKNSRCWLVFNLANSGFNNENQVLQSVVNEKFELESHQSFSGIELFLTELSD